MWYSGFKWAVVTNPIDVIIWIWMGNIEKSHVGPSFGPHSGHLSITMQIPLMKIYER